MRVGETHGSRKRERCTRPPPPWRSPERNHSKTIPQDYDYEFIEVKVSKKIDIHLSLDDLNNAVQQQANDLAAKEGQVDAQVAAKLSQLNQLATQIKSQLPGGGH